jgi:lycopene cyclase domain-containing protein
MKLQYLIFNLIIFFLPILSFIIYPKIEYPLNLNALLSIFLAAAIFIFHDVMVVNKWWRFNEKYIIGIKILKLPVEEILFFFSVSFSCLTIWINFKNIIIPFSFNYFYFFYVLIFLYYFYLIIKNKKIYLSFVLLFYLILLIFDWFSKTNLLLNFNFLIFTIGVFLLTLIFNYYLTKTPIVIYNKKIIINIRILTIPIEDFLYGINFLYLTILLYEFLGQKFF